jgi:signal transduction histidine kinase
MSTGARRPALRRRVLAVTLLVAVVAVAGFGIPLALALTRMERERVVLRLERTASELLAQVSDERLVQGELTLPRPLPGVLAGRHTFVGVYAAGGHRLSGNGPATSRLTKRAASTAEQISGTEHGQVVVVEPLRSDRPGTAVVRVAVADSAVSEEVAESAGWITLLAAGVLLVTTVVSVGLARRLARPLEALADRAQQLGDGDFAVRSPPADTVEIDAVGRALDLTADRLRALVERERAFTANASHQMRTPLTALRTTLETAQYTQNNDVSGVTDKALKEVDRLEATLKHLLAIARDIDLPTTEVDLRSLLDEARQRWTDRLQRAGRTLVVVTPEHPARVRASATGLSHVLDVLLDNALRHGGGSVTVTCDTSRGADITVRDEGAGIGNAADDVFRRRHDSAVGHGIGLALARALVEADGGRLELTDPGPHPTFTMTLPLAGTESDLPTSERGRAFR